MSTDPIIPSSWKHTQLEIFADINPKLNKIKYSDELEVSFIPMKRVSELTGVVDLSEIRKFGEVKKGYTPFQNGDIIFAKITPCMENGKVAILNGLFNKIGFGSTEFHVLRLPDYIPRKLLFYYLIQESYRRDAKRNMTGSVGQKRVPSDFLKHTSIPLPPLPEQHRIVAKIEELFTKLDTGVEALKQAQAKLKLYRQSVLKAAVEGRLTAKWREKHLPASHYSVQASEDELEPADKLLERILKERREKWEAEQLARYEAQVKTPPKNWQDKYKEPTSPDTTNLPELPEGWVYATIDQISIIASGQTPKGIKDVSNTGDIPWYKVGDMNKLGNEKFMDVAEFYLTTSELELLKLKIQPKGTIIFPKRGGAIHTNKKRIMSKEGCYDLNTMGIIVEDSCDNYFWHWFHFINLGKLSDGSNVPQINHKDIEPLVLPLPPKGEQKHIKKILDQQFLILDSIQVILDFELKRAQALRQSILKRAFEGKLVSQDPNDLPTPRPGKYFIYVLECSNGSYYIGHTENIEKRWINHAGGGGADWTRKYPPVALVHWEEYNTRTAAAKREKELKTGFGRKWIKREIKEGRTRQAGEPASVLLEKIKSEKAKSKKSKQMEIQ